MHQAKQWYSTVYSLVSEWVWAATKCHNWYHRAANGSSNPSWDWIIQHTQMQLGLCPVWVVAYSLCCFCHEHLHFCPIGEENDPFISACLKKSAIKCLPSASVLLRFGFVFFLMRDELEVPLVILFRYSGDDSYLEIYLTICYATCFREKPHISLIKARGNRLNGPDSQC